MHKILHSSLAAAVATLALLTGCGSGVPEFDGTIEDRVSFIADFMGHLMPLDMGDGLLLRSVKPEGRELILDIETDLQGSEGLDGFDLTKMLRPMICKNDGYRGVIEKGGVIRIDFSDPNTGKALPPGRVANCEGV